MKFQMVRHLWERNDVKDAIIALRKLPDHSVSSSYTCVRLKVEFVDYFYGFKLIWNLHFLKYFLGVVQVQADVVSVFMEKMEIINMDLFSCMLPVLVGLLDSKMERWF